MARILSAFFLNQKGKIPQALSPFQLLETARQFSPVASWDRDPSWDGRTGKDDSSLSPLYYGINLEVSGSSRLFKGEHRLVSLLEEKFIHLQARPRISVAPSLGAAWALSRFGKISPSFLEKAEIKNTLSPLPVAALRLPQVLCKELRELGLLRIADLLRLPRKALMERFSKELLDRLSQAFAEKEEVISCPHPAPALKAEMSFESPLSDQESVLRAAGMLLDKLLESAKKENKKISSLVCRVKRCEEAEFHKKIFFRAPTAERSHIFRIIRNFLEELPLGFGVEGLGLLAVKTENISYQTLSYFAHGKEGQTPTACIKESAELLDTLCSELSEAAICSISCRASHVPEKSFSYLPLSPKEPKKKELSSAMLSSAERPTLLFYRPQTISAISLLPDSAPAWLKWKDASYRVIKAKGPERIAPEWWGEDACLFAVRDYFRTLIDDGSLLWIFRDLESGTWYVHGIWA